jgi:hypothetical protein
MNPLPISENDQIRAMLTGSIFDLLRDFTEKPELVDIRKYITISRQQLIEFLFTHPDLSDSYFKKHSGMIAVHDVEIMMKDGAGYLTAWMDHGHQVSTKRFATLAEAIAEHVLVTHGMY